MNMCGWNVNNGFDDIDRNRNCSTTFMNENKRETGNICCESLSMFQNRFRGLSSFHPRLSFNDESGKNGKNVCVRRFQKQYCYCLRFVVFRTNRDLVPECV